MSKKCSKHSNKRERKRCVTFWESSKGKMGSNFKVDLLKSLKGTHQYFPELKKSTLRTIIESKNKIFPFESPIPSNLTRFFSIFSYFSPVCVHYIQNKSCTTDDIESTISKISRSEHFYEQLSGILIIFQTYLRSPKRIIKDNELKETLKELKFEDDCSNDLCKVLVNHKDPLSISLYEMKTFRTPPKKLQWRINISLMGRLLKRPRLSYSLALINSLLF